MVSARMVEKTSCCVPKVRRRETSYEACCASAPPTSYFRQAGSLREAKNFEPFSNLAPWDLPSLPVQLFLSLLVDTFPFQRPPRLSMDYHSLESHPSVLCTNGYYGYQPLLNGASAEAAANYSKGSNAHWGPASAAVFVRTNKRSRECSGGGDAEEGRLEGDMLFGKAAKVGMWSSDTR